MRNSLRPSSLKRVSPWITAACWLACLSWVSVPPADSLAADGAWSPYPNAPTPQTTPPHRHGHSMVLDAVHQRLVVFGGYRSAINTPLADTWIAPLSATPVFDSLEVATDPGRRYGHGAVYDAPRQRMLVFDGVSGPPSAGMDVWALDLGLSPSWSPVAASGAPSLRRQGCSTVHDPVRDRVLLFGGHDGFSFTNEVLVFSPGAPAAWSTLSTIGTPPAPRNYSAVIYDPVRDRLVVFAGNSGPAYQDVHALDLSVSPAIWSELSIPGPLPGMRLAPSAIYDAVADRMVVFGGILAPSTYYGDVWALSLSGSPAWNEISPPAGPSPRHSAAAVYDPAAARMIVSGGESMGSSRDDLWSLSLAGTPAWARLGGSDTTPGEISPATHGQVFTYDPARRRILETGGEEYFGSGSTAHLRELLLDSYPSWRRIFVTGSPPSSLRGASLSHHAAQDLMFLFGGYNPVSGWTNEVRQLSLNGVVSWSVLSTLNPPTARNYHSAVIDLARNRLIVFGGNQAGTPLNDLWWLDLSTLQWTQVTGLPLSPSPRLAHRAVLDPATDRMWIYGGVGNSGEVGDVWSLNLATLTWSPVAAAGGPGPRHSSGVVLDALRNRLLVHGGYDGTQSRGDLWELTLVPVPSWRLLIATGSCPPRHGHGAAYDPIADRLIVHAGYSSELSGPRGDTWQFVPGDHPTSALASLASLASEPGRVRLVWYWASAESRAATVERGSEDGSWRTIGHAAFDREGRLDFTDTSVEAGTRYAYRLAWEEGGIVTRTASSWVRVPEGYPLALSGFWPNPNSGDGMVSFAIPTAGEVRLDVLDVAGRRVLQRTLPKLAPGSHRVKLGENALPAGLYVVRLSFGGRTLAARGAVIR